MSVAVNPRATWIDPAIIEAVRAAADIAVIAGRYMTLHSRGRSLVGQCLFHPDKTPSFSVDVGKGLYHCFGCDARGDVFRLVERAEGISFTEAVRLVAEACGVDIPALGPHARPVSDPKQVELRRLDAWARKEARRLDEQVDAECVRLVVLMKFRDGLRAEPKRNRTLLRDTEAAVTNASRDLEEAIRKAARGARMASRKTSRADKARWFVAESVRE